MEKITFEEIKKANESIVTTDVKGKEYAEVNQRIKAFRMIYPTGFIIPKMVSNENGMCIFEATVGYYIEHNTIAEDNNEKKYQDTYLERVILATGTAYEKENSTFINKTSYIENCETSAVGRALGMAGFGIDTSVASAEEVQNAIANQKKDNDDNFELLKQFEKLIMETDTDRTAIYDHFEVNNNTEMTNKQLKDAIAILKKKASKKHE